MSPRCDRFANACLNDSIKRWLKIPADSELFNVSLDNEYSVECVKIILKRLIQEFFRKKQLTTH